MNREDRELLAELRRLNSDVVPFAMKIMDESVTVTAEEQYTHLLSGWWRWDSDWRKGRSGRPAEGWHVWLRER
jgi:hypothetical protein